jgi:hypothetical protein
MSGPVLASAFDNELRRFAPDLFSEGEDSAERVDRPLEFGLRNGLVGDVLGRGLRLHPLIIHPRSATFAQAQIQDATSGAAWRSRAGSPPITAGPMAHPAHRQAERHAPAILPPRARRC